MNGWRLRTQESPAGQEVEPASPELAGAGACEDESPPVRGFQEGVDDPEKLRHPLYLVDDDGLLLRGASDQVA